MPADCGGVRFTKRDGAAGTRGSRFKSCPRQRGTLVILAPLLKLEVVAILKMTGEDSLVQGGATGMKAQGSRSLTWRLSRCVAGFLLFRFPGTNRRLFSSFLKGGTAHRAPGLGRQNRKQRLGEYAAERGAVLGFAASAAASGAAGGRTKRARGVGVGNSNAPDSDETDEDGIETESEIEEEDDEDMDVDALAARVTIVFEGGRGGALPGYVYLHSSSCVFGNVDDRCRNTDSSMSRMRFVMPFCARACCVPLCPYLRAGARDNALMTIQWTTQWMTRQRETASIMERQSHAASSWKRPSNSSCCACTTRTQRSTPLGPTTRIKMMPKIVK
jgi:hypothetical protein